MTFTPTANDPLIGKILAERYRITELVGSGRFSIVYKGQHLFMDRAVAMKTLQSNLVEDQTIIKRFEKEAVALSKLRHPNIVSVYDCFVHTNGQPFLVMDFLDGHTLEELLADRGAIPPKLMRAIIFQASAGLAHAHASGVLHRDIKPDNIILLPREKTDERVRLLDFGFALLQGDLERLTLSGTLCGSPAYISPERWKGKELDARSDIYSLAVVMFQGLTGQLPFRASSLEELRNMHVSQEPPLLGDMLPALKGDETAQQIISKAMAKSPEDRYQTMKDFHNAIKGWSPSSDDAEIAQWAKNVAPKPPKEGPTIKPVIAQPISLQPMPLQMVQQQQGTVPPPAMQPMQPGQTGLPDQAAPPGQPIQPAAASQGGPGQHAQTFDDAKTLPNNSHTPLGFDDSATLPTGDAAQQGQGEDSAQQPGADPQNAGHKGYVAVDINDRPLSPEALARIPKPNPRASLTKQDVAYIKAIAQTLGDSLGDEAKSIEITPKLEEQLAKAPIDETSRLNFSAMPAPANESTIPQPGPKVVPEVDRRQNKQGGDVADGGDTVTANAWNAPDMSQSLSPGSTPFGYKGPQPALPGQKPPQPPGPVPAPPDTGQVPSAASPQPGQPAPVKKTSEQPVSSDWSAKQPAALNDQPDAPKKTGEQPVGADWTVKQEVAPWVNNPDDFKPKADASKPDILTGGAAQSPAKGLGAAVNAALEAQAAQGAAGSPSGSPGFGAPSGPPGFGAPSGPPGFGTPGAPSSAPGFPSSSITPPTPATPQAPAFPMGAIDAPPAGAPGSPGSPPSFGPFGTPAGGAPTKSSSSPSSRISPELPTTSSDNLKTDASDVGWTNATSSSPVDFGKLFPGTDEMIARDHAAITSKMPTGGGMPPMPGVPGKDDSGIKVTGSDGSTKGSKKRNRLPTFVDKEVEGGAEGAELPKKKGSAGMLIAGVAATVFVVAGIGIATWMITNVNPSNNQANTAPNGQANAPADTGTSPSTAAPATTTETTTETTEKTPADTTATEPKDKEKETATTEPADTSSSATTAKEPEATKETPEETARPNTTTRAPAETASAPKPVEPAKPPEKPPVTTAKAPPPAVAEPVKEEHQSNGWFGFGAFNKNNPPKAEKPKPEPTAVTAVESAPAPKPKKKKPKKPKKIPVAHHAAPAASSSGGYIEVEVSPSRRAYRSY